MVRSPKVHPIPFVAFIEGPVRKKVALILVSGDGEDLAGRDPQASKRLKNVDYSTETLLSAPKKVGGRFFLMWVEVTYNVFVLSVIKDRYQISVRYSFSGGIQKSSRLPHHQRFMHLFLRRKTL